MGPRRTAPAAFLGHGNPMNALEDNVHTRAWRRFGEACGRPRAVLVVSAHWYLNASAVTAMARPRTIHDFYGFPRELSEFVYPAPGSPEVAREVAGACGRDRVVLDEESWGLDHGTWSVLAHCFPDADIPVVQLAINALQPFEYHIELGRRLAPLRETGVVVVGSGNLVHNLHRIRWETPESGFDWAVRFDAAAREALTTEPDTVTRLVAHPDYGLAAPTPDHFIPLLYLAGLAEAAGRPATVITSGLAYGSVSMTAFALDMPRDAAGHVPDNSGHETTGTPPPAAAWVSPHVAPEQTNM